MDLPTGFVAQYMPTLHRVDAARLGTRTGRHRTQRTAWSRTMSDDGRIWWHLTETLSEDSTLGAYVCVSMVFGTHTRKQAADAVRETRNHIRSACKAMRGGVY
jgi:hypothetical protein